MDDHSIVALYLARDEQAIHETAAQYGGVCMQISMNILHSRADAEECVNDTYLRVWNSIPPQRPLSLRAFVCRIVRNLSINRLRDLTRDKRNRDLEVAFSELEGCLAVPEEDEGALAEVLTQFLRGLDKTDRLLFMGRYWHACSVQTLAGQLGMTPNHASVRLHRIREALRVYLKERGYDV